MNKALLIVVAIVLLLGAVGAYLVLNKRSQPASSSTPTDQKTETKTPKSLKELFSMGSSQQCSFKDDGGNSGIVYVGEDKVRGDFNTVGPQGTILSHMIVNDQTSYMWMDGQTKGFKIAFDTTSQENAINNVQSSVDLEKKVDLKCSSWNVDPSKFNLPTDVGFSDMGALTVPPVNSSATPSASQCAACDSVPESARAQCKAALGCN